MEEKLTRLRLIRTLILTLFLIGCRHGSIIPVIKQDTQCSIHEYDGRPEFGGIEILEQFQKSNYDVDLIRLHKAVALDADYHYERLYLASGRWHYVSDDHEAREILINQRAQSSLSELIVENHFVSFFCQPGALKASRILIIAKQGASMGIQCDVDLASIQLSDKRLIDYINIFKQVEEVIKSVDE